MFKYIWSKLTPLLNKMKRYTSGIHSLILSIFFLVIVYLCYSNFMLNKKLNSGVVTTMKPEVTQPNDSSDFHADVFLTFVGVGFALFSFLTFQSVKDLFDSEITKIKDEHKSHKKDYKKQNKAHINRLKKLENSLDYQMSELVFKEAKLAKDDNFEKYVMLRLTVCEHLSKVLEDPTDENQLYIDSIQTQILNHISVISTELNSRSEILYNKITPERLRVRQERISKVLDGENLRLLNVIFGKIKITSE